ncbi:hypothetical protein SNEBB_000136 [Seison nebaliae]|nr:hypothetical protein SNEBB_000136 [Seison nebaliae]
MKLKCLNVLMKGEPGNNNIMAMAWSNDGKKFAICDSTRTIRCYDDDGNSQAKFLSKPAEPENRRNNFIITGIVFSPDGSKLAVAQTDSVIYVYSIGKDWSERRSIMGKFKQPSPVTCVIWPVKDEIIYGLMDGKVKKSHLRKNKSSIMINTNSMILSITPNLDYSSLLIAQADGNVYRLNLENNPHLSDDKKNGNVFKHSVAPYAIAWTANHILVGGCDRRIVVYTNSGKQLQQIERNPEEDEKEFRCAVAASNGQMCVFGTFNKLYLFNWLPRKNQYEIHATKYIKDLYVVSCLSWSNDCTKLCIGGLTGTVIVFECTMKKQSLRGRFDVTKVRSTQYNVTDRDNPSKSLTVKSKYDLDIQDLKIYGKDRYVVAYTSNTLILGDIQTKLLSEVAWESCANEKFYFDNPTLAMVFASGELSLIEYGLQEITASVRTEFKNPHLISVRFNERQQEDEEENKKLAYLMDLRTICIVDIIAQTNICQIPHTTKIEWLELNETGEFLLFRDRKLRLHLFDVEKNEKRCLMEYCRYVSWLPDSDIVIAQNRDNLCVWYNIKMPDNPEKKPCKGEVDEIIRERKKTKVIIQESLGKTEIELDNKLIEFDTSVSAGKLNKALDYLETVDGSDGLWMKLAIAAMEKHETMIAERCYAALKIPSKARFIRATNDIAKSIVDKKHYDTWKEAMDDYTIKTRVHILDKNFALAENLFLEHNDIEGAIEMYILVDKWKDAINLAEQRNYVKLPELLEKYFSWLEETKQHQKAGELKEKEGQFIDAIENYMTAGMPTKAAMVVLRNDNVSRDHREYVEAMARSLVKKEFDEQAADLFNILHMYNEAISYYIKGNAYSKAVETARQHEPNVVLEIQKKWAKYLVEEKRWDAAINHFIEAHDIKNAISAGIKAGQFEKSMDLMKSLNSEDMKEINENWKIIGKYFGQIREFKKAEKAFIEGEYYKDCIEMYYRANEWDKSFKLAKMYLSEKEISETFMELAKQLGTQCKHREAEKLYIKLGDVKAAVKMYYDANMYDSVVRLVKEYEPNILSQTHGKLAENLIKTKNYRHAESHYVSAEMWSKAVDMYKKIDQYEDAFRVAKVYGGIEEAEKVGYEWTKRLGPAASVRMFRKYNFLENFVRFVIEKRTNEDFDLAYNLADRSNSPQLLLDFHLHHALYLEDEGNLEEAERKYLICKKPREAMMMYIHKQDWGNAKRIAESTISQREVLLTEIMMAEAKDAFESQDYELTETLLVEAKRSQLVIDLYKSRGMWKEALKFCHIHLPQYYEDLREEADRRDIDRSGFGMEQRLEQAETFVKRGNIHKAVSIYVQLTSQDFNDKKVLTSYWERGVSLAKKHFNEQDAKKTMSVVATKFKKQQLYTKASEYFLYADEYDEAIELLLDNGEYEKAARCCAQDRFDISSKLRKRVEQEYKTKLYEAGDTTKLAALDKDKAISLLMEKGNWREALTKAKEKGETEFQKQLATCAMTFIDSQDTIQAIKLFKEYGITNLSQNYGLYKKFYNDTVTVMTKYGNDSYERWADIRELYRLLIDQFTNSDRDQQYHMQFKKLFTVAYRSSAIVALENLRDLESIRNKLIISLVRFVDIYPADRAFYNAGLASHRQGWLEQKLFFFNYFLDIQELIDSGRNEDLDISLLNNTDIPKKMELPKSSYLPKDKVDELREELLYLMSQETNIEQKLRTDDRDCFDATIKYKEIELPTCVITGYPCRNSNTMISFPNNKLYANRDDWNTFIDICQKYKMSNPPLNDYYRFICKWTESNGERM